MLCPGSALGLTSTESETVSLTSTLAYPHLDLRDVADKENGMCEMTIVFKIEKSGPRSTTKT